MRDRDDMRESRRKMLYSGGKGGSGTVQLRYFPAGPQQNPGVSPVSRTTWHLGHECIRSARRAPHFMRVFGIREIVQVDIERDDDIVLQLIQHKGNDQKGVKFYLYITW